MSARRPTARGGRPRIRGLALALAGPILLLVLAPVAGAAGARALHGPPVVVSPAPQSATALPGTQISLLGIAPSQIGTVVVTGSVSGRHRGRLERYSTGTGASFVPSRRFVPGETVTVVTSLHVVGATDGTFSFTVARPFPLAKPQPLPVKKVSPAGRTDFASEPNLDAPIVTVSGDSASLGGKDLLLAPKGQIGATGPMILGPTGRLIYFQPIENAAVMDLNVQHYEGQPVLTWWQGRVVDGHGEGEDLIVNDEYETIATVQAGNGLHADLHDFVLSGSDTAWITAYAPIHWNLTSVGGTARGDVWDGVVQEIDVPTGLVMFQWDALNELPVGYSDFVASANNSGPPLDWFHLNAVEPLGGHQLLVSSRDTSAVYDLDLANGGTVRWTLGGKGNDFDLGRGVSFTLQHDAKIDGDSILTMFDNSAAPKPSYALVLRLDTAKRTATLVRAYKHSPTLRDYTLGSTEPLGNGDTLISWGTSVDFDVVNGAGTPLLSGVLPGNDNTYRTLAASWSATPAGPISLATHLAAHGNVVVAASWNGATNVARWRILAGGSPSSLAPVETVAVSGFECVSLITSARYVAVEALSATGAVERTSATVPTGD